jgi:DNA mismatch repair ATPase MutL
MINKIYKHANYAFAISLPYEEIDLNFSIGKDIVSFSDIQNVLNLFQDGSERDNVLNLFQDRKEMAKTRVETMSEPKNDIRAGYSNQLELLIPIKDSKDVVVWNNKIFPISKDRLFPEETVKPIKITKNQILESVVLGQVDRKFIACKTIQSPSLLFLIDQHASHERILLEQFIKGRNERKYECKIVLSQPEHHLLFSKTISGLKNFGIEIEYEKCNDDISLHARLQFPIDGEILKNLIYNCMEIWGKTDKFNEMPLKMMELYKSKSCRNAIMFGDRLTFRDCQDLKTALSFCDFPFQCAHGRPTCVPLIEISTTKKIL